MLVPSGIHAKYPIPRNAESLRNPRFSRAFTSKITHSIPRRPNCKTPRRQNRLSFGARPQTFGDAIDKQISDFVFTQDRASQRLDNPPTAVPQVVIPRSSITTAGHSRP